MTVLLYHLVAILDTRYPQLVLVRIVSVTLQDLRIRSVILSVESVSVETDTRGHAVTAVGLLTSTQGTSVCCVHVRVQRVGTLQTSVLISKQASAVRVQRDSLGCNVRNVMLDTLLNIQVRLLAIVHYYTH